jgi:hypothetical protein
VPIFTEASDGVYSARPVWAPRTDVAAWIE